MTTTKNPSVTKLKLKQVPYPWCLQYPDYEEYDGINRSCVLVAEDVEDVGVDVCDELLPQLAHWNDPNGQTWHKLELPSGQWEEEYIDYEDVQISLINRELEVDVLGLRLPSRLPGIKQLHDSEVIYSDQLNGEAFCNISIDEHYPEGFSARDLIGAHVDFVNDLFDQNELNEEPWEENLVDLLYGRWSGL